MTSHRHALERLAAYLDGLRTPIDGWQVALQMQQIAREALGAEHVEVPELPRESRPTWTWDWDNGIRRLSKPPFHDHYPR